MASLNPEDTHSHNDDEQENNAEEESFLEQSALLLKDHIILLDPAADLQPGSLLDKVDLLQDYIGNSVDATVNLSKPCRPIISSDGPLKINLDLDSMHASQAHSKASTFPSVTQPVTFKPEPHGNTILISKSQCDHGANAYEMSAKWNMLDKVKLSMESAASVDVSMLNNTTNRADNRCGTSGFESPQRNVTVRSPRENEAHFSTHGHVMAWSEEFSDILPSLKMAKEDDINMCISHVSNSADQFGCDVDVLQGENSDSQTVHGDTSCSAHSFFTSQNSFVDMELRDLIENDIVISDPTVIYFNDLPVEIIHMIFSFLCVQELCRSVCGVCRLWRDLGNDPIHWQSLDLCISRHPILINPNMQSGKLNRILQKAPLLKSLYLNGQERLHEMDYLYITMKCPHLCSLDLGFMTTLSEDMLQTLVDGCTQISHVNLEGCPQVKDSFLVKLCGWRHLLSVNVSHCIYVTDEGIVSLGTQLLQLHTLNIDGITGITDSAISKFVHPLRDILREFYLDGDVLTDAGIAALCQCSQLRKLSISFAELLTDAAMLHIRELSSLQYLRLKRGAQLSTAGLGSLFEGPGLRQLYHLNLSECSLIHDCVVHSITQCCGAQLRQLELQWCWHITDTGLEKIVNSCSKLEYLNIVGLDKIVGASLEKVPTCLPMLTYLDLSQCNEIQDALMIQVIRQKPDLKVINYYGENFHSSDGES